MNPRQKVSLITDMDMLYEEFEPQLMLMVRPQRNRKYPKQRMTFTVEVVDLSTLNLEHMRTFEML